MQESDGTLVRRHQARLVRAIAELPRGQRDAVVLFHVGGLAQSDVAERLGTRAGAIRTRLHKARAALRARIPTDQEETMPDTLVPATVLDVRRTPARRHVVLLDAAGSELPIWISPVAAEALVAGLHGIELPRPDAHALALALLRACGHAPAGVRIVRLHEALRAQLAERAAELVQMRARD